MRLMLAKTDSYDWCYRFVMRRSEVRLLLSAPFKSISYTLLIPSLFFIGTDLGPMGSGSNLFTVRVR
nr:MAG TPA: hypothetical protein [Caudoviricetes sp.]